MLILFFDEEKKEEKINEKKEFREKNISFKEDKTKYGEFVSSYFQWIPVSEQKKRAEELDNMTKNNKENKS